MRHQVVVLRVPAPDAESGSEPAGWDWTILTETDKAAPGESVEVLASGPLVGERGSR